MRSPDFWDRPHTAAGTLLRPLAAVWTAAGRLRRARSRPWRAPVPVICVGNAVAGGAGKTPVVRALAQGLRRQGRDVHVLSRGYGGRVAGPLRVEPARHDAAAVGDEPLLLAREAPTWIGRDRAAAARAAVAAGAELLLLDDGLQNPHLVKDLSLLVIDGGYGLGNGLVMPAGPLREPLADALARSAAVVLLGDDRHGLAERLGERPLLAARLEPGPEAEALAGRRVVAFAGIGRPAKFFATLREAGAELVAAHAFPDHHRYAPDALMRIVDQAQAMHATPVTTEKDAVRLPPEARDMVDVLSVHLVWRQPDAVARLLAQHLPAADSRPDRRTG